MPDRKLDEDLVNGVTQKLSTAFHTIGAATGVPVELDWTTSDCVCHNSGQRSVDVNHEALRMNATPHWVFASGERVALWRYSESCPTS
jgi:hypothetical protein